MKPGRTLHGLLDEAAARYPDNEAVELPGRAGLTYRELSELSDRVRDRFRGLGVRPGDRVGLCLPKSVDSVALIFGTLKAGAAYVPVDADGPPERAALIFDDCDVRAVVTERRHAETLGCALAARGATPAVESLEEPGAEPVPLRRWAGAVPTASVATEVPSANALAYVLYTSGSTGRPKGVMLTHANALSFVDWCARELEPRPDDRFSSHAPLHFDLSILDVFVSLAHGSKLVLIDEDTGKQPLALAPLIAESGITVWYSTPSILNLLARYGKLERHDFGALRTVLFAGEVFPPGQLRALMGHWPGCRYLNLYGPTETNVCTWYEIPAEVPAERTEPYPIGEVCPPNRARVVDGGGATVPEGAEGELLISGPNVMRGYWNLPEADARAFVVDLDEVRWYRTGDVVVAGEGGYRFVGRRDRMVKRSGYRVELGEIEAALAGHPDVREAAAVASVADDGAVKIHTFLGLEGADLSVMAMKRYCVEHLPRYMVPDAFHAVPALPRTSTDKVDYQALERLAAPTA